VPNVLEEKPVKRLLFTLLGAVALSGATA